MMPTLPMVVTVDDRRVPRVFRFGQPPVAVNLFRPTPSVRRHSTSILPMYVRLARLPEPGCLYSTDEQASPVFPAEGP